MTTRVVALAALLLAAVTPAGAHRVDEYLQAIILSVEKNAVKADMYLTPGVDVTPRVLADVDSDGNGVVSEAEKRAYATRVLGDLSLTLNATRLTPRLVSIDFPNVEEMKDGVGDIHLEFQVDLTGSAPDRRLRLENHHQRRIAIYQVNCLISRDPLIRIGAQRRDETQSVYELEFTQTDVRAASIRTESPRL